MAEKDRKFYKNPPVIERAISLFAGVDAEQYEKCLAAWEGIVRREFPEHEPIPHYTLNVAYEQGVPVFDPTKAEVFIQHRFWQRNNRGKRSWCLQIRPDRLTINLLREPGDAHKFEEISAVAQQWAPRWADHFDITNFQGTTVEYVNLISARVTPQFIDRNGGIAIGQAFRVFSTVPLHHHGLIPPYNCEMTVVCDSSMPCYLSVQLFGAKDNERSAIQIRFRGRTEVASKAITLTNLFTEVSYAHSQIVHAFEELFTDEAKTSFDLE